jgi:hypothetical protein
MLPVPKQRRGRPRIHIDRDMIRRATEQFRQLRQAGSSWEGAERVLAAELGVCVATLRSRIRAYRQGDMAVFEPPLPAPVTTGVITYEAPSPEKLITMLEFLLS